VWTRGERQVVWMSLIYFPPKFKRYGFSSVAHIFSAMLFLYSIYHYEYNERFGPCRESAGFLKKSIYIVCVKKGFGKKLLVFVFYGHKR
jgi:hypothetical protein